MFDIDSILTGPFWSESIRVISSRQIDDNLIKLEAVGIDTKNILRWEDHNFFNSYHQ